MGGGVEISRHVGIDDRLLGEKMEPPRQDVGLGSTVGGIRKTGRQRHTQRDNQSDPSREPSDLPPVENII